MQWTTTAGMRRTWCRATSPKCKHSMCIVHWKNSKTKTNWLKTTSQPRCRLPTSNSWVLHLPCRHPKIQVLFWSLNQNSPAAKIPTCWHKVIYQTIMFYRQANRLSSLVFDLHQLSVRLDRIIFNDKGRLLIHSSLVFFP